MRTTTSTAAAVARLPRLSIYEIKRRYQEAAKERGTGGYWFDRETMRFFGQTLRAFKVVRNFERGTYTITAPSYDRGRYMGTTCAEFDPKAGTIRPV